MSIEEQIEWLRKFFLIPFLCWMGLYGIYLAAEFYWPNNIPLAIISGLLCPSLCFYGAYLTLTAEKRWRRKSRKTAKYREMTSNYLAARDQAKRESKVVKYWKLPVFPAPVPFCEEEKETWSIEIKDRNWEDFVDSTIRMFRARITRPDVMLMRGENHKSYNVYNSVLLVVDEVEESGSELAIVALVVTDEGRSINLSIRWSSWPASLLKDLGSCTRWGKFSNPFLRFFNNPQGYERAESDAGDPYKYWVRPRFSDNTELRAKQLADSLKGAAQNVIRT
ncbi:MAG: hypothetical protein IJM54_00980 [Thermoguttaceae bacterium]|nr:hypothetical protein [Thermoguttaceae bacterium]